MLIEWATCARPKPGHDVSGDAFRVRAFADGVLSVVVDGIGHGSDAAAAAAAVLAVVDGLPAATDLTTLVSRCHDAARRTRGVVMSAAWLAAGDERQQRVDWIGVGNVEAVLRQQSAARRERLLCAGGIVGERLPKLMVRSLPLVAGDVLVLATDGAPGAVLDESAWKLGDVGAIAQRLLVAHALKNDDALVLVARAAAHQGAVEARGAAVEPAGGAADVR